MRILFVAGLLAGCSPATCPPDQVAATCQRQGIQLATSSATYSSSPVLTAWEARQLAEPLADLRAGARIDAAASGLCRGATTCEARIGASSERLAQGTYHLEVRYQLPARGNPEAWSASLFTSCLDVEGQGDDQQVLERRALVPVAFEPILGEPATLVLPTISSPRPEGAQACNYRVVIEAPRQPHATYEGSYAVPGPGVQASEAQLHLQEPPGLPVDDAPPPPGNPG